jgi:hypothetical protein
MRRRPPQLQRSLLGLGLLSLLGAPSLPPVAAAETEVTPLHSKEQFEQFVTRHKPQLNKVLFFSKLGGSTLCDKLAEEFSGRLDFAVVSKKDDTGLEQQFGVDEFPALRVVITGGRGATELNVVAYEGSFKFGAFDEISAWFESGELAASAPGAVQLSPGDELTEHCGGDTPCVVLLTAAGDEKHDALVAELAAAYAGDLVTPLQIDATAWPEAAEALGVSGSDKAKKSKKKKKKSKKAGGAGTAVFIGPMTDDRNNKVFLHRVLQKPKQFTVDGVQRFVRSSMSLAAESVEGGEAAEGLRALRLLPRLNGGSEAEEDDSFAEEEEDDEEGAESGQPASLKTKQPDAQPSAGKVKENDPDKDGSSGTTKKTRPASTPGAAASEVVRTMKAKAVAKAAAAAPLLLLLVSAQDHSPACTAAESLLQETAEAWATSEERAKAAEAGATAAVEFALVSLQGKKKSAIESDLERLDMRVDQLPAYRWYRGGEPWDWCRNASFPPFVC